MKTIITILAFLSLTAAAYAQRDAGSTYRCQNSELVHVGDSAFIIALKCGKPLHKEVINTGYGKGGQIVSEWYYPMKNGWYGVLTIRAGKLIRIGTIQAK
jgi:hypothetical protein